VVLPRDRLAYRVDALASEGSTTIAVPTDPASPRHVTARSREGIVTVTADTLR
jgi:hypothetical protein